MTTLYDSNGQPIEAYTQAELDEMQKDFEEEKQKEIDNIKSESEEKAKDLQIKLDDLNKKLEGDDDKKHNFAELRKQKQTVEERFAELEKTTGDKIAELESQLESKTDQLKVDSLIEKMSGNDPELRKKVRFYYDSFQGVPEDDEKLKERIENSILLATGSKPTMSTDFASVSGDAPPLTRQSVGKLENPESAEVGKKLGLTDEDLKDNNLT